MTKATFTLTGLSKNSKLTLQDCKEDGIVFPIGANTFHVDEKEKTVFIKIIGIVYTYNLNNFEYHK